MKAKHICIIGGSDGLGKETARQLVENGHKVTIVAHIQEETEKAATEMGCDFEVCDVSNKENIEVLFDTLLQKEPIECLVNCVGMYNEKPLAESSYEDMRRMFDVNTLSTMYSTKFMAEDMRARGGGKIINVVSTAGVNIKPNKSLYYASKHALTGFTKSVEEEYKPYNVNVSGFYPGGINTKLFEKNGINKDTSTFLPVEDAAHVLKMMIEAPDGIVFTQTEIHDIKW